MKIGACAHDVIGGYVDKVRWLAENGFHGLQVWKRDLDAHGLGPSDLLQLCRDSGLEISAVGGGPNLVDPRCARETVGLFREFLDLSVILGPRIVTAESKGKPDGLSEEEAWRSVVATVGEICRYAESVGAVLAIEPAGVCFIRDHEMWFRLAEAVGSPSLKVNYDPANIVHAGRDPVDAARALAPHIVHTHAKDYPYNWRQVQQQANVPAGEGVVDYRAYLHALREAGYEGYLTIEMHAGAEDRRLDIARAASNLRRMLEAEVNACSG